MAVVGRDPPPARFGERLVGTGQLQDAAGEAGRRLWTGAGVELRQKVAGAAPARLARGDVGFNGLPVVPLERSVQIGRKLILSHAAFAAIQHTSPPD